MLVGRFYHKRQTRENHFVLASDERLTQVTPRAQAEKQQQVIMRIMITLSI